MKKKVLLYVVGLLLLGALAWAGTSNFEAVTVTPAVDDSYGYRMNNSSGTRIYSVDSGGNAYISGTLSVTGVLSATSAALTTPTITSPTITSPTVTSPVVRYGYTSYPYTSGSGSTYSVASTDASPGVYRITGGSGTTTFVMSYTGTAAGNAGKIFYIINSSSNSVTFMQSGATGVTVATLKIVTVVGNGTDFERITADQ